MSTWPKRTTTAMRGTDPKAQAAAEAAPNKKTQRIPKAVLLVDMDAFFASVEQAQHPHLRNRPVIVCGDPSRRGVVTAASYEARPAGVHAGMPLQEARALCPDAEYVEGNPDKYVAISLQLLDLYTRFTPDVEPFSVDEAFVGLQGKNVTLHSAAGIARTIQQEISERFQLGASIGVGPNKLIAKMGAGANKPRGLTVLDQQAFQALFWPKEVQEMWGVGPKLATRMRSLGIQTVGDLARAPDPALSSAFGVIGPQLKQAARGEDDTPLVPYHKGEDAKSMGHEVTLSEDSKHAEHLKGMLLRLCDQVARRLRNEGFVGRVVALKLRNKHFVTRMRQRALTGHTDDHTRLYEIVLGLLEENWNGEPLRLIGVTVSMLSKRPGSAQTELFDASAKDQRLREALDGVRDKLGEASVVPAGSLMHRRTLSHVPFGAASPGRGHRPASGESL